MKKHKGVTVFAVKRVKPEFSITDIQRSLNALCRDGFMVKLDDGSYMPTNRGKETVQLEKDFAR